MARTSSAKVVGWGTPPEPEPTGWDAIAIELGKRPGEWANLGDYAAATARKIVKDRFPDSAGYDSRVVPNKDGGKVAVWVSQRVGTGTTETAETADAAPAPKTAKRGGVV